VSKLEGQINLRKPPAVERKPCCIEKKEGGFVAEGEGFFLVLALGVRIGGESRILKRGGSCLEGMPAARGFSSDVNG